MAPGATVGGRHTSFDLPAVMIAGVRGGYLLGAECAR